MCLCICHMEEMEKNEGMKDGREADRKEARGVGIFKKKIGDSLT